MNLLLAAIGSVAGLFLTVVSLKDFPRLPTQRRKVLVWVAAACSVVAPFVVAVRAEREEAAKEEQTELLMRLVGMQHEGGCNQGVGWVFGPDGKRVGIRCSEGVSDIAKSGDSVSSDVAPAAKR